MENAGGTPALCMLAFENERDRDRPAAARPMTGSATALLRLLAASLLVGGAAFLVSLAFWPIEPGPGIWLIRRYEALSLEPFGPSQYSHRILAPLLAHALQLDGERFRIFTLGCSVLLLAGIYAYCRRAGVAPVGSALVVLAFALTRTVGNSSLFPGLTDTLSYLLLLLGLMALKRPFAFWALFALNLLNHEQIAFLLPWLLYVRWTAGAAPLRTDAALGLLALVLYAVLRKALGGGVAALHVAYTVRPPIDYLAEYGMVWWFLWTSFGFLLALLIAYGASGRRERTSALLCLACSAAPYLVAWDPYRYIHLAFGVFLMAAVWLLRMRGGLGVFAALLAGNVLLFFASRWIMDLAVARIETGCQGAADPVRCIHLATLRFTLPSLAVLPLMVWVARRQDRERGTKAREVRVAQGARELGDQGSGGEGVAHRSCVHHAFPARRGARPVLTARAQERARARAAAGSAGGAGRPTP